MIRRAATINEGHEESVFKPIGWEEFSTKTARLESLPQLAPESQVILELIRDALDFKKLNNNLMKITMFEDLIADLYARLYEINMPSLIEHANDEGKEKMKLDHLMGLDGQTEASTPATSVPASDTPAPRGRTKGIARRDIQKRADTIVSMKLAPRAAASKVAAAGETDPSSNSQGPESTPAGQKSGPRGSNQKVATGDDGANDQQDDNEDDETELSENEDTKLDEEPSTLFPSATDAEEVGSGDDEGPDNGPDEDDEGEDGDEGEGDEDEEMQDEETKLEEDEAKSVTVDQYANDTETEPSSKPDGGEQDTMEITPAES